MTLKSKPSAAGGFVSSVWTFPNKDEPSLRSPYRWYGTLPTALVNQILDLYAVSDSHILAPFGGSGTVGITAALRDVRSTSVDVNPLAVLISRARSNVPEASLLHSAWVEVWKAVESTAFAADSVRHLRRALNSGTLKYTAKWFTPAVLDRTWALIRGIGMIDDPAVSRTLYIHAATAIRAVANIDPRCTHHLVTKIKPYLDPAALVGASLAGEQRASARLTSSTFLQGDVTALQTEANHDLVVAHPPYLGVIHYNQIHRLATDLFALADYVDRPIALADLDWTHASLKANDMSTDNGDRYETFVAQVASSLSSATSPDGRAIVIIGDQRNKGLLRHPFTSYIRELEARGLALEENFIWVLQNNGGMHVLRRGHFIDHNYILVFRKQS